MVMPPVRTPMEKPMNLISAVFDFSFSSFVTTRIVRFVYVLLLVLAGLMGLMAGFGMVLDGRPAGLILVPVVFFVMAVVFRIWLEVTIVLFRIAENVQQIAQSATGESASRYASSIDDEL